MRVYLLLFVPFLFGITSCEKFRDDVLPIAGVYEANVVGVAGPFSMSISIDHGDNILIEAPFDGEHWEVIGADVDTEYGEHMDIDIDHTDLSPNVYLSGDGFFLNGDVQLDYDITINGKREHYTIVGSK